MLVLGIETSCDETGVALYDTRQGLIADMLHSQAPLHARWGGVVPELASRDHIRKTLPLLQALFAKAGRELQDVGGVAYTAGPGLIGALRVGAALGRALAYGLDVPALGVHHMEAHLLAPLIEPNEEKRPRPPFVALLVSGGHSQLVRVDAIGRYALLGESVDDAVGEAFDKVGKLLGLGYPGGPAVAAAAERGDPARFRFPRPMTDRPGLDMSFSGLKTAVANQARQLGAPTPLTPQDVADISRAFEEAAVDTLVVKCRRAVAQAGCAELILAGGVAANRRLRGRLTAALEALDPPVRTAFAAPSLCTDNGAMVAHAGALRLAAGERSGLAIAPRARWPITELTPLS